MNSRVLTSIRCIFLIQFLTRFIKRNLSKKIYSHGLRQSRPMLFDDLTIPTLKVVGGSRDPRQNTTILCTGQLDRKLVTSVPRTLLCESTREKTKVRRSCKILKASILELHSWIRLTSRIAPSFHTKKVYIRKYIR